MFCSPLIGILLLDHELHKCFSVFFPSLDGTRWIVLAGIDCIPSSTCVCMHCSVMSHSLQHHGLYVAHQAPLSWNFPGENTRMGCHFLLQEPEVDSPPLTPALLHVRLNKVGLNQVFPFLWVTYALIIPQQVRLQVISFP